MFYSDINQWLIGAMTFALRYFVLAGLAYFVFYILFFKKLKALKIQDKFPNFKQLKHEILFSICAMLIYGLSTGILIYWYKKGFTKIYTDLEEYGIIYFVISILLIIVIHDTYFYWSHRLMHSHKWLYHFHKTHHISTNPTPWTSFSFHPIEAIISIGFVPIVVFLIPVHPYALLIFFTFMTLYNILIHLGFKLFQSNYFNQIFNNAFNHDIHHQKNQRHNFGFYFVFWDRVMGTLNDQSKS
ncbi:sterol desaturase family protein [Flavobacterium orientale]|uniref:Sterol desaturase n=1 Tax=Flavobacterium orientale TaxID=1756020 RepID=A0A916XWN7_9FLAO|nr:sterol desaturase family protein [Flavobacterium orientale]GGD15676.1 sterol desaturase [Flavobacterium orientale]